MSDRDLEQLLGEQIGDQASHALWEKAYEAAKGGSVMGIVAAMCLMSQEITLLRRALEERLPVRPSPDRESNS